MRAFLTRTEWRPPEPGACGRVGDSGLLALDAVVDPGPRTGGAPRLDGIYEQILAGAGQLFVGSRPSTLPAPVNRVLADASGRIEAGALQALGYVGRCSFDHLVLGNPQAEFTVRFTECNGRWGGTSTPMHLVDRVVPGPRPCYRGQGLRERAACRGSPSRRCWSGSAVTPSMPAPRTGRYIFYNVGPLAEHGKLDVIALGATQAEAEQALLADFPRLLDM